VLKKIENGIHYTGGILTGISGVLFLGLMFLGAGDVAGRYLFNKPIMGTMEASEILMAGVVLLSWAYSQRIGIHVRMRLIISQYSPRAQAIVNFITLLLSLVLFSFIFWQSLAIAIKYLHEHRVFQTLPGPSAPYYFFVPVGAFFLCLEFITQLLHLIPEMRRGS
jgi:TRAP-type C4-dicarboxylate transport system permease small subunit